MQQKGPQGPPPGSPSSAGKPARGGGSGRGVALPLLFLGFFALAVWLVVLGLAIAFDLRNWLLDAYILLSLAFGAGLLVAAVLLDKPRLRVPGRSSESRDPAAMLLLLATILQIVLGGLAVVSSRDQNPPSQPTTPATGGIEKAPFCPQTPQFNFREEKS